MWRTKGITIILALAVGSTLLAMALGSASSEAASPSQEPIKIGALLSFTGALADYGPPFKAGLELRMEEAKNTVAGRPIQLIIEDDGSDTSVALEKTKKLVERDKVKVIIGPLNSGIAMGIAPYLGQSKVIDFGISHHPLEITKQGIKVFPMTLYTAGLPVGWYAYDKLGYRKVTALGADYVGGRQFVGGNLDAFTKRGGTAVQQQWAPLGTVDYGPYLSALQKADAMVAWSGSADLLRFIKQYHEFGIKMPMVITVASSVKGPYMKELGDNILGVVGGAEYTSRLDNPSNKQFVAAMKRKFGIAPDKDNAATYTVASIVLAALETTKGDTTYENLNQTILNLKLDTPLGPLSFTPSGVAVTNRYIVEARKIDGEYVWEPIYTYPNLRDPNDK